MRPIAWLPVLLLLGSGGNARAMQDADPPLEPLRVSLSSDRATYYRGEAVKLRIRITNTSDVAVPTSWWDLDPRNTESQGQILWRRPGVATFIELDLRSQVPSPQVALRGPRGIVSYKAMTRTLNPGQSLDAQISVAYTVRNGSPHFVLDEAGKYEFQVRGVAQPRHGTVVESDILSIRVVETDRSERDAETSYAPPLAYFAYRRPGLPASAEEIDAAAAFIDRYPGSRYAAAVRASLLAVLDEGKRRSHLTERQGQLHSSLLAESAAIPHRFLDVSQSPMILWPPDRRMVPVTMLFRVIDEQGNPDLTSSVSLDSVTCDDSCDLDSDVQGADRGMPDTLVELRADAGRSGVGRTYTLSYSATTATSLPLRSSVTVTVPNYEIPAPWSSQRIVYERGSPVSYQGAIWICRLGHESRPQFAPTNAPMLWERFAGQGERR
jgi:hypothetical protein